MKFLLWALLHQRSHCVQGANYWRIEPWHMTVFVEDFCSDFDFEHGDFLVELMRPYGDPKARCEHRGGTYERNPVFRICWGENG